MRRMNFKYVKGINDELMIGLLQNIVLVYYSIVNQIC